MKTLIIALLLPFAAYAGNETSWTGYKAIKDVGLPYAKVVAQAVVMIQSPLLDKKGDGSDYTIVEVSKTKKVTDVQVLNSDTSKMQIETCRKQGLEKCPVFKYFTNGSGIIDNGSTIYTCRHVINNWVLIAAKENRLTVDQVTPPIIISDSNKNILYNSATDNQIILNSINTDPRMISVTDVVSKPLPPTEKKIYFYSEFVEMTAPNSLVKARSLNIQNDVRSGEGIYLSGFPQQTKFFGPKGDAPGYELVTSSGTVTSVLTNDDAVTMNALATGGMSGGIVTRADGTVLGMICKTQPDMDLNKPASLAFLINPETHKALWDQLSTTDL